MISKIYRCSLSLLTDFYQLTMTYGYWKKNIHNKEACFNVFFRERPFKSGYAVSCGLEYVIDFLKNLKFTDDDLKYLKKHCVVLKCSIFRTGKYMLTLNSCYFKES